MNDRFAGLGGVRGRTSPAATYAVAVDTGRIAWKQLDLLTRTAFVATVIAVLGVVVPPVSLAGAVVAIVCSGVAVVRSRRSGAANRMAQWCLAVSTGLVVLVVVGSAIYAALD